MAEIMNTDNTESDRKKERKVRRLVQSELDEIVRRHESFLLGRKGGARANLSYCDLSGVTLAKRNLSDADFTGAVLQEANLQGTKLDRAILFCADLRGADLQGASLNRADLRGA